MSRHLLQITEMLKTTKVNWNNCIRPDLRDIDTDAKILKDLFEEVNLPEVSLQAKRPEETAAVSRTILGMEECKANTFV